MSDERDRAVQRLAPAEAQRLTDLHFNPPLLRVGMLQWERFDDIVAQGHAHGVAVLGALADGELASYRAPVAK